MIQITCYDIYISFFLCFVLLGVFSPFFNPGVVVSELYLSLVVGVFLFFISIASSILGNVEYGDEVDSDKLV